MHDADQENDRRAPEHGFCGDSSLALAYMLAAKQELSIQVAHIDGVKIHDLNLSEPRQHQNLRRAEPHTRTGWIRTRCTHWVAGRRSEKNKGLSRKQKRGGCTLRSSQPMPPAPTTSTRESATAQIEISYSYSVVPATHAHHKSVWAERARRRPVEEMPRQPQQRRSRTRARQRQARQHITLAQNRSHPSASGSMSFPTARALPRDGCRAAPWIFILYFAPKFEVFLGDESRSRCTRFRFLATNLGCSAGLGPWHTSRRQHRCTWAASKPSLAQARGGRGVPQRDP